MESNLPLEKEMQNFFTKFPPLPPELISLLVKVAPFLALLGGVLGALGLLSLGKMEGDYGRAIGAAAYGSTWQYYVSIAGGAVSAVIYLLAFAPLRAQKKRGWDLMYYAFLITLVLHLVTLSFLSLAVGFLLGGWILFGVKPHYS